MGSKVLLPFLFITFVLISLGIIVFLSVEYNKCRHPPFVPRFIEPANRINCYPEEQVLDDDPASAWTATESECELRGCIFDESYVAENVKFPVCYIHPDQVGYKVNSVNPSELNEVNVHLNLTLEVKPSRSMFEPSIKNLRFQAIFWNNKHLQVRIKDADNDRYEVPFEPQLKRQSTAVVDPEYEVSYEKDSFSFKVIRKSTESVLFDSSIGGFVFSDRFLQMGSFLPSKNVYGLGEHEHPSLRHDVDSYMNWPIFSRGQSRLGVGSNLYGNHPFFMVLENHGDAHGMFWLNSNAMEYQLISSPAIVMRSIGGIFDFHFVMGPTPTEVIQQHTEYVGRPVLPPYWALGFHLARYGYNNFTNLKATIDRNRAAEIPIDVIHVDIDTFDGKKDFTLDQVNFGELPDYFENERKTEGLRSVTILDPGLPNITNYEPWQKFMEADAFVTWPNTSVMLGYVFTDEKAGFPDWFLPEARDVWKYLIKKHSETLSFDGLWIDLSEPSLLGTNEEEPPSGKSELGLQCPVSDYDDPPYRTRAAIFHDDGTQLARLSDKTLCMSAHLSNGKYRHYDVHNLYGWLEAQHTLEAIQETNLGKRGFVLARSNFASNGQYGAHWLGSNQATWEHMRHSIISVMEMSMFGIAQTGPDLCGHYEATTPELCLRWMQHGALLPFARNHNHKDAPDQDPAALGDEVEAESREYLQLRYTILPYLYTLFYQANQNGVTVARPVFFEFPRDRHTWDIDRQFMLGSAVMVVPILDIGKSAVTGYVPEGRWLNMIKSQALVNNCDGGRDVYFDFNGTAVLQRGGTVIPKQSLSVPSESAGISTARIRKNPISLDVLLDCDQYANGSLFWDDGESISTIDKSEYALVEYEVFLDKLNRFSFTNKVQETPATTGLSLVYDRIYFRSTKTVTEIESIEIKCSAITCPTISCYWFEDFYCDMNKISVFQSFTLDVVVL